MFTIANARAEWPQPPLPDSVNAFAVGNQLTANGIPMRVQGFVAPAGSVGDLVIWFRGHWGQPLMENTLGRKRILGRVQGGFYWTVQLEPSGLGSRGLVAVTDISVRVQAEDRYAAATDRLLARFPMGSHLISYVVSPLEGRSASHLVVSNRHSVELNRDVLKAMLVDEGMVLEREVVVKSLSPLHRGDPSVSIGDLGKTLFFKGKNKEAIAVIRSTPRGDITVILNTVTTTESFKK